MVRLRSPLSTLPAGIIVPAFPQRSPPSLFTTAVCGGLGSVPDDRTRRALLHLSYSCISPFGPAIFVTHDPQETLCSRATLVWLKRSKPVRHNFAAHNSAITLPFMTGVGFTCETRFVLFGAQFDIRATQHEKGLGHWHLWNEKRKSACSRRPLSIDIILPIFEIRLWPYALRGVSGG